MHVSKPLLYRTLYGMLGLWLEVAAASRHFPMSDCSGGQKLAEVKKLTEIQINWLEDFFFFKLF